MATMAELLAARAKQGQQTNHVSRETSGKKEHTIMNNAQTQQPAARNVAPNGADAGSPIDQKVDAIESTLEQLLHQSEQQAATNQQLVQLLSHLVNQQNPPPAAVAKQPVPAKQPVTEASATEQKLDMLINLLVQQQAAQKTGLLGSMFSNGVQMPFGLQPPGYGPAQPDHAAVGASAAATATLILQARLVDQMTKGMPREVRHAIRNGVTGISAPLVESGWSKALTLLSGVAASAAGGFAGGIGKALGDKWTGNGGIQVRYTDNAPDGGDNRLAD